MKLAIVDLDNVIADSSVRMARAQEAKEAYIAQETDKAMERYNRTHQPWDEKPIEKKATDAYWRVAFTPELVALDTAIEGAIDALATLAFSGHYVMLLTSRPESMRQATRQWLFAHDCPLDVPMLMKPSAYQFVKTAVWKAGTVQMWAAFYDASDVLFVDDEDINRSTLMDAWMAQGESRALIVASSLKDALEKLREA